jgi:UDP-glucose 4-epimerase
MDTYIVTGGAGFIGSHVVDALIARGDKAVVIDDLSTGQRANVAAPTRLIEVDIADAAALGAATSDIEPCAGIFHCAAQASVVASLADPARDRAVNLHGTEHVLVLAERLAAPVVLTSTAAVYGVAAPLPTPEHAAIAPASPYAASKAAAEAALRASRAATGLPHAICRLANVYGPRQRGDGEAGVIAVIAQRLRNDEPITLYGHGEPTRDFVHVADVARALIAAMGTGALCNVGTGAAVSVRHVFDLESALLPGHRAPVLADLREGEIMHSCLDVATARHDLGWRSQIAVDQGVPATIRAIATT